MTTKMAIAANNNFGIFPHSAKVIDYATQDFVNIGRFIAATGTKQRKNHFTRNAILRIKSGSYLHIKSGANVQIKGSGKLLIEDGAYLCVEPGASIQLQDYNSVIAMMPNAVYETNPSLFGGASCQSSPIVFTGNGCIPDYSQDVYIQNENITTNRYIGGRNIYVGNAVTTSKPQGDVLLSGNATSVIFDALQEVVFDAGFECASGSTFEVINSLSE